MDFVDVLNFSAACFDLLAWPLFALGYPLCASIRVIETKSISDIRKLETYWVLFSLISLFDHAFAELLERIPVWPYIKLTVICWLVIPHFDGSYYVYQHLIHPCLSMDTLVVTNWHFNESKRLFRSRDNFLALADRYIKENGAEDLVKLLASKSTKTNVEVKGIKAPVAPEKKGKHWMSEEPDVAQKEIQVVEVTEIKNWEDGSKRCEGPNAAKKEIKMTEVTQRTFGGTAQWVKYTQINLCETKSHTTCIPGIKERTRALMTAEIEACRDDRTPETPLHNKVQKEWACAVCQVTTQSEASLNSHLQGRRHQATSEQLKAKNQATRTNGSPSPSMAKKSDQSTKEEQPQCTPNSLNSKNNGISAASTAKKPDETKDNERQKSASSNGQNQKNGKEWACSVCQVTTQSEAALNVHLQAKRHQATFEQLKAQSQATKINVSPSASMAKKSDQSTKEEQPKCTSNSLNSKNNKISAASTVKKPDETKDDEQQKCASNNGPNQKSNKEWSCAVCQVTAQSEAALNSHLQGKRHQATSEQLKAQNQATKISGSPSASMAKKSDQFAKEEQPMCTSNNLNFKNNGISAASTVKKPDETKDDEQQKCASGNGLNQKSNKEWSCAVCQVTTQSEATLNSHLQGKRHQATSEQLKAQNQATKINAFPSASMAKKPDQSTKEEQPNCTSNNLNFKNVGISAASTVKKPDETKDDEQQKCASGNGLNQKSSKEWSCAVCQVTTQSEATFNSQLQGKRHQATSEQLKGKYQTTKAGGSPSASMAKKSDQSTKEEQPKCTPNNLNSKNNGISAALTAKKPDETKDDERQKSASSNGPNQKDGKEWACSVCQVTTQGEAALSVHLQAKRHQATLEQLKAQSQATKINGSPSASMAKKSHQSTKEEQQKCTSNNLNSKNNEISAASTVKKPDETKDDEQQKCASSNGLNQKSNKEWSCAVCQVTAQSEAALNSHLQGKRQQATSEQLKAQNQATKINGSRSASMAKKSDPFTKEEQPMCTSNHLNFKNNGISAASTVKKPDEPKDDEQQKCASDNGLNQKSNKEWSCAVCQVTTQSEATLNSHLQGKRHQATSEQLKAQNKATKINAYPSALMAKKSDQSTKEEQPNCTSDNLNFTNHGISAASTVKKPDETKDDEQQKCASGNGLNQKSSKEWSCAVCQVTTQSEATLNSHLQGKRHQATLEQLKAKYQTTKTNGSPSASMAKKSDQSTKEGQPRCTSNNLNSKNNGISAVSTVKKPDGTKDDEQQNCASSNGLNQKNNKEWACAVCQVTTQSEVTLNSHLQGRRHQATLEQLKAKNQATKINGFPSASMAKISEQSTKEEQPKCTSNNLNSKNNGISAVSTVKEPDETKDVEQQKCASSNGPSQKNDKEWACAQCQVTTQSEATLNSHLQGKRHRATSEQLKAKNQATKANGSPSASMPKKSDQSAKEEQLKCTSNNLNSENSGISAASTVKIPDGTKDDERQKCTSSNELKQKNKEVWACAVCQVTTQSEATLNSHLQEKRHQATSEQLKAKNQVTKASGSPSASMAKKSDQSTKEEQPKCTSDNLNPKNNGISVISTVRKPDETKDDEQQKCASSNGPNQMSNKEWSCAVCQVTAQSEAALNSHLQGKRHQATSEQLKAQNQATKINGSPSASMAKKSDQSTKEEQPMCTSNNLNFKNNGISAASTVKKPDETKGDEQKKCASGNGLNQKSSKEWSCVVCQVTTQSEATLNSHLQGKRHQATSEQLKAQNQAPKINAYPSASMAKKSDQSTKEEQPNCSSNNLNFKNDGISAASTVKKPDETKDDEQQKCASGNGLNQKSSKGWSCAVCQVTTQSEATLNSHLQGKRHQATSEQLKAQKQATKSNASPSASMAKKSDQSTKEEQPNCTSNNLNFKNVGISAASTAKKPDETKDDEQQKCASGNGLNQKSSKEWSCAVCQVTTQSEATLNSHLQGKRHQATSEQLKAQNQATKSNASPSASMAKKSDQSTKEEQPNCTSNNLNFENNGISAASSVKKLDETKDDEQQKCASGNGLNQKSSKEWSCAVCQVTTQSEATLNSHLQGKRHLATFEQLKAENHATKASDFPSASMAKKSDQSTKEEQPKCTSSNLNSKNCGISTASTVKMADETQDVERQNCASSNEPNQKNNRKQEKALVPQTNEQGHQKNLMQTGSGMKELGSWCNICNVSCTSELDMASHLKGRRHFDRIKQLSELWCSDCNVKCNSEVDMASHRNGMEQLKEQSRLWCSICSVSCNSEVDMDSHLNGRRHRTRSRNS